MKNLSFFDFGGPGCNVIVFVFAYLLCISYCLLSFVILSDQPLSGKHAMSCWSQLEATCLYFCHRLKEKRYVLGFSFRSRLLSYLYQVVQSSSCHHHEKRKRIMMQTVDVPGDVVGHQADEDDEDAEASDDIVGHQAGVPPLT